MNNKSKMLLWISLFMLSFSIQSMGASHDKKNFAKDFRIKGFHLDLRIQVMKIDALKTFATTLSKGGINTLIMEYEATFPFTEHPIISNRYAYTKEEIRELVKHCEGLGIDVIPLQQSFGHVEYILRYPAYAHLRESRTDYSQVNPMRESAAVDLFRSLFSEMAELHPSKYFHIGCDETRLLGRSTESKAKVEKFGVGALYGDYVKLMCDIVLEMGKVPVLWADIALKYPEALKSLPKGVVFVDWNYGWELHRFGNHQKLMQSGFEVWGAPSLRSSPDNYNLITWEKHFNNIRDFIPQARSLGYTGMIMTSWSTSGEYSYIKESGSDLIDLYAIRRVYPLSGFNILLQAYLQAIHTTDTLKVGEFVRNYAKDTFGFNEPQSVLFSRALFTAPYQIGQGEVRGVKGLTVKELLDSVLYVEDIFESLNPLKNKIEFEHYRLISETRSAYVNYQYIEKKVNSENFQMSEISYILKELRAIISKIRRVNKDYIKLNKSDYYSTELEIDNDLRLIKVQALYDRLSKRR